MKKLLSLFLALTMVLTMSAPALAVDKTADPDQPGWQQMGYDSLEAMLEEGELDEVSYYSYFATPAEQTAWIDAFLAAHPDEAAAFDAEACLAQYYGADWAKAEYMEMYELETDADFVRDMTIMWINDMLWKAERQAAVEAYTAAHPDEVAAFDANAYFEAKYMSGTEPDEGFMPYYESKEEFMSYNGLTTEEEFKTAMLGEYIEEQEAHRAAAEQWAATVAAEPALTAQFLADVDSWIATGYWYNSVADYMEQMNSTAEEAYNDLYEMWKYEYEEAQQQKAQRDARIKELGGTPGQINVLVNDKMMVFGSAKPVIDGDGTLNIPAELLAKTLGIIVKGDANGYAPLRFTAENAGWDVLWDNEYQTAVLLNRNGIIGEIDAKFTKLDTLYVKLLDMLKREEGQAYKIDETLSLKLTAFDSLDGDKTYTAGIKGTSTVKDGVVSASLTLELAGLIRQLSPELRNAITSSLPKQISVSTLTQLLTGIKVDVILNPEDGLYIHAPILAQFIEGFDADSWLYFENPSYYYGEEETAEMAESTPVSLSIGSLVYADQIYGYSYYYNQIDTYSDMLAAVDALAAFLGNDRFAASGDNISYKLDTKTVNDIVAKSTEDGYTGSVANLFRTADMTATLSGGTLSFKAEVRPNTESVAISSGTGGPDTVLMAWLTSLADFRLKTSGSLTASGSDMSMEFHWKNQFEADISYTSATQKTNAAPAIEPPADADVVDAYDFFYSISPYAVYDSMYGLIP